MFIQILHCFDVCVHPLDLAVGHEHDAVDALEDQFAGGVVVHLAGHGIEVELDLESADGAKVNREKIEEQRTLGLSGQ